MSFVDILRDALFGNPPSPTTKPSREGVLAAFTGLSGEVSLLVSAAVAAGAIVYQTRASLYADLARPANALAVVVADSDPTKNGAYVKVGASGSGSWTLTGILLTGATGAQGAAGDAGAVANIEAARVAALANIEAAGVAVLTNAAFTVNATSTATALSGTVDGQLATVPQESNAYLDTYRHTGSYLALSRTDPVGDGFLIEQKRAIASVVPATPQFLTQPDIHIVPIDALKRRNAMIPNRIGGVEPTRNMFQLTSLIVPSGATITPNYSGTATRFQINPGNTPQIFNEAASADYHVRFQARSKTGAGAQTFKVIKNGSPTVLQTINTVEGSDTDVSLVITGATQISLFCAGGDAAADVLIDKIVVTSPELAAPQVPVPSAGALVNSAYLTKPGQMTVTNGALVGPYPGFVKMGADGSAATAITAGTFIATFKKRAASIGGFPGPFMSASPTVDLITLGEQSGQMKWSLPGGVATGGANASTVFDGQGFVTMSCSFDTNGSTVYIDGIPVGTGPGGTGASVARFWWGGGPGYTASSFNGDMGPLSIWTNERLSDVAMSRAVAVHRAELTLGGSLPGIRNFLLPDGDSITYGQLVGLDGAYVSLAGLQLGLMYRNQAVPGSGLANLVARKGDMLNRIRAAVTVGIRPIVTIMIGVNGFPLIADYQAYVDELRAAGGYVILCTVTGSLVQSDATKAAYNASIRTMRCDAVADIAAKVDPVSGYALGTQAAANTAALFPDQLHPSAYANQLMRDVIRPVIAAGMQ